MLSLLIRIAHRHLHSLLSSKWLAEERPDHGSFSFILLRILLPVFSSLISLTLTRNNVRRDIQDRQEDLLIKKALRSPWWQTRIETSRGARIGDIPPTNKEILRPLEKEVLATRVTSTLPPLNWQKTSGTTGEPFMWGLERSIVTLNHSAYYLRSFWYWNGRMNLRPPATFVRYNIPIPFNWLFLAPFSQEYRRLTLREEEQEQATRETFNDLGKIEDLILFSFPNEILALAKNLERFNLTLKPSLIVTTGQILDPEVREYCERIFRCAIRAYYVVREAGPVAFECSKSTGTYHVNEERLILEILDQDGHPCPEGEEGNITLTPLDQTIFPLLRYQPGDRGRFLSNECACGTNLQRIVFSGRTTDYVIGRDGTLIPLWRIRSVILSKEFFRFVKRFQILHPSEGHLEIRLETTVLPERRRALFEEMRRHMNVFFPKMEIQITANPPLVDERKFKPFLKLY